MRFWSAFIHTVRNAMITVSRQVRNASHMASPRGKSWDCELTCGFVVEIADDGRGIDWTSVARRAEFALDPNRKPPTVLEGEVVLF
jgi:hypothetical protein